MPLVVFDAPVVRQRYGPKVTMEELVSQASDVYNLVFKRKLNFKLCAQRSNFSFQVVTRGEEGGRDSNFDCRCWCLWRKLNFKLCSRVCGLQTFGFGCFVWVRGRGGEGKGNCYHFFLVLDRRSLNRPSLERPKFLFLRCKRVEQSPSPVTQKKPVQTSSQTAQWHVHVRRRRRVSIDANC